MSLAQLLSLGKNDSSSELIPSSTYEPPLPVPEKPKKEPPPPEQPKPAVVINEDELKLAQELVMSQDKVLQEDAKKREADAEAFQKQTIEDAAKAAAKRAEMLKASKIGANPFSTGGKGVFKPWRAIHSKSASCSTSMPSQSAYS